MLSLAHLPVGRDASGVSEMAAVVQELALQQHVYDGPSPVMNLMYYSQAFVRATIPRLSSSQDESRVSRDDMAAAQQEVEGRITKLVEMQL